MQAPNSKFPNAPTPSPSPSLSPSPSPDSKQVLAILVTCLVSYLLPSLGFVATPLFGLGVVFVIVSIGLYSRPMHVPCIDDDD